MSKERDRISGNVVAIGRVGKPRKLTRKQRAEIMADLLAQLIELLSDEGMTLGDLRNHFRGMTREEVLQEIKSWREAASEVPHGTAPLRHERRGRGEGTPGKVNRR